MCIRDKCRAKHCLEYSGPCNASLESYESAYECIKDKCRAKHCLQYSGPCNASLESYECLCVYQG